MKLISGLNQILKSHWNTTLVGGFEEPVYLPSLDGKPAEIRYTRDYVRSALHELAHWCIAGIERRKLVDYGYWYRPDGRNLLEQDEFFRVEVKPQAIEKAFAEKWSIPFAVSCDNLSGIPMDEARFEFLVSEQLALFRSTRFPKRAAYFLELPLQERLLERNSLIIA